MNWENCLKLNYLGITIAQYRMQANNILHAGCYSANFKRKKFSMGMHHVKKEKSGTDTAGQAVRAVDRQDAGKLQRPLYMPAS